jgi:ABC-type nitrate/sulfonate/bicarbonate transport system permease component
MNRHRLRGWLTALAVPVALGLVWELLVYTGIAPGRLMPPPSRLLRNSPDPASCARTWRQR